jgi:hypothetical protein
MFRNLAFPFIRTDTVCNHSKSSAVFRLAGIDDMYKLPYKEEGSG